MNRQEDTIEADKLRWYNDDWAATPYKDGVKAYDQSVHISHRTIDIDGPVSITFDEYYTTIEGDMELTISYVEREYEGEPYKDDVVLDSIEVVSCE